MSNPVNPGQAKNQVEPLLDRVKKVITKQEILIGVVTTVALAVLIGVGAHFGFLPNMPWQDVLIALGGTALVLIPVGASAMLRLRQKPQRQENKISLERREEPKKGGLQYHIGWRSYHTKELFQLKGTNGKEWINAILNEQHPHYDQTVTEIKQEKLEYNTITHYEVKLEVPNNPKITAQDINRVGYIHVAVFHNGLTETQIDFRGLTKEPQSHA